MTSYKGYAIVTNDGWPDSKDIYGICLKQVDDELHVFWQDYVFTIEQAHRWKLNNMNILVYE